MDILYVAILLAFYGLICALALGCDHLQKRKAGPRTRKPGAGAATTASMG